MTKTVIPRPKQTLKHLKDDMKIHILFALGGWGVEAFSFSFEMAKIHINSITFCESSRNCIFVNSVTKLYDRSTHFA
jgi:hypothetical protein